MILVDLQERVVFHYSGLLEANQFGGYTSRTSQVTFRLGLNVCVAHFSLIQVLFQVKLPQKLVTWTPGGPTTWSPPPRSPPKSSSTLLKPAFNKLASKGLVTWVPEHSKKRTQGILRSELDKIGMIPEGSTFRDEDTNVRLGGERVGSGKGEVVWRGDLITEELGESTVRPKSVFYSKFGQRGASQPREVIWNGEEFVEKQSELKPQRLKSEGSVIKKISSKEENLNPKVIKYKNILNSYNTVSTYIIN